MVSGDAVAVLHHKSWLMPQLRFQEVLPPLAAVLKMPESNLSVGQDLTRIFLHIALGPPSKSVTQKEVTHKATFIFLFWQGAHLQSIRMKV